MFQYDADCQSSRMLTTEIKNIKLSVNFRHIESLDTVRNKCSKSCVEYKEKSNYICFKLGGKKRFSYTIFRPNEKFPSPNHINITGIKSSSEINFSVRRLRKFLGVRLKKSSIRIDNITGSLNTKKEIFLKEFVQKISQYKSDFTLTVKYNNESFPGAFVRVRKNFEKVGTIIFFHSGKVIFVGCSDFDKIKCLELLSLALTQTK